MCCIPLQRKAVACRHLTLSCCDAAICCVALRCVVLHAPLRCAPRCAASAAMHCCNVLRHAIMCCFLGLHCTLPSVIDCTMWPR